MSWKNTLRKQELNMDIGSTNYAKDNGDSVTFKNKVTVSKDVLGQMVKEYDPSIVRMTQITMSSGMTDKFVMWLEKNPPPPSRSQTPYSSTTAGSPEQTAFQQNY